MPVDVRIDDATIAHAEIVVVDERYALRVIDVVAGARARLAPAAPTGRAGNPSRASPSALGRVPTNVSTPCGTVHVRTGTSIPDAR